MTIGFVKKRQISVICASHRLLFGMKSITLMKGLSKTIACD